MNIAFNSGILALMLIQGKERPLKLAHAAKLSGPMPLKT